jgi:hypothetical protein
MTPALRRPVCSTARWHVVALPKVVADLAQGLILDQGVAPQQPFQGRQGQAIGGHRRNRLRRVDVATALAQPDQIVREQEPRDDASDFR